MAAANTEVIRIGQIEIRFLADKSQTGGSLGMFELTVPPGAKVPAPHYHRDYDETIYGLAGTLTMVVDGEHREIGPGDGLFIPRGSVHKFVNTGDVASRTLAVMTPDMIGAEYFRELSALMSAGGPPDPAALREIMMRYGLVPVPEAQAS